MEATFRVGPQDVSANIVTRVHPFMSMSSGRSDCHAECAFFQCHRRPERDLYRRPWKRALKVVILKDLEPFVARRASRLAITAGANFARRRGWQEVEVIGLRNADETT
ncbi:hypothetical protein K466DRAFT_103225 [Polyporus arcularius HHB13444]|uniref:Uncharacterized protein n=1 Tax=Polyporus arcularius HHB13444 TaxID=1314778 RepID=A0A5C3PD50_9APHY|nr:hypothetical protein K466DRAFT_103225 [Polyporus arcularius HHB13444]